MTELETQVVKIQLGDNRQSNSFIYTLAETIELSDTEIYVICELPMFNPAAKDECQRISEAITASLKRSYRKTFRASIFENALATINEELAKLVALGKSHWLGKLNAIVAVKHNSLLSVASVGKISALLYRDDKFISINESSTNNQPVKTFEQFSEGKLKLGDMFILSTSQLFNHISIDRIKNLIDGNDLPLAAQSIIEYLQSEMGPEVACGTIFALQVEAGSITDEEVDLAQYLGADSEPEPNQNSKWLPPHVSSKLKAGKETAGIVIKNLSTDIKNKYLKPSFWKKLVGRSSESVTLVHGSLKKTAAKFQPNQIAKFSNQKKFFLISAAILLIALVTNIAIVQVKKSKTETTLSIETELTQIEKLLNDTNAAVLYGDEAGASDYLAKAQELLGQLPSQISNPELAEKLSSLQETATELDRKLKKIETVNATTIGTLGNAQHLINLPNFLATETNRTIVSYNKTTRAINDNSLKSSESILDSVAIANNQAVIYNGTELFIWDLAGDIITGRYNNNVPSSANFGGIKTYSTNNRIYVADKSTGQVKSFATTGRSFSNMTISVNDELVRKSADIAIDGNIYIISGGNIYKFNSGAKQQFNSAVNNFSDASKIITENNFQYLYILDPAKKQIIILNKTGGMIKTVTSDQFTDLRDFAVEESTKTIFVLNGSELLRFNF